MQISILVLLCHLCCRDWNLKWAARVTRCSLKHSSRTFAWATAFIKWTYFFLREWMCMQNSICVSCACKRATAHVKFQSLVYILILLTQQLTRMDGWVLQHFHTINKLVHLRHSRNPKRCHSALTRNWIRLTAQLSELDAKPGIEIWRDQLLTRAHSTRKESFACTSTHSCGKK